MREIRPSGLAGGEDAGLASFPTPIRGGWLGGLPHAKLLLRTLVALRPLKMQEAVICENMTKLTA